MKLMLLLRKQTSGIFLSLKGHKLLSLCIIRVSCRVSYLGLIIRVSRKVSILGLIITMSCKVPY